MADEAKTTLVSGAPVDEGHREINPATGMQRDYVVLSAEERAKGFVRPVRDSYVHVGIAGPKFPTEPLTDEQRARFAHAGYVAFEPYPAGHRGSAMGRYWTQAELDKVGKGCGTLTTMARPLAETYARNPRFYGGTFCCGCRTHLPVGEDGEFIWAGTDERVGT